MGVLDTTNGGVSNSPLNSLIYNQTNMDALSGNANPGNNNQSGSVTTQAALAPTTTPSAANDTSNQGFVGPIYQDPTNPPAGTNAPAGTNYTEGGWYNGQQYHNGQLGPAGQANWWLGASSGSSGTNNDIQSQIDSQYNTNKSYLEGLIPQLQGQADTNTTLLTNNYTGQQQTIADQLAQLVNQNQQTRNAWDQKTNSAYSQAQNAYNQLLQRNLSLYGGQGAGQAINSILGQGYQQANGQLADTNMTGQLNLAGQDTATQTWGDTQNRDLDSWFGQAKNQINQSLQDGINQINNDIALNENGRTNAKIELLTSIANQQQALEQYDLQLRNAYSTYNVLNNPSQYGGSNMDNTAFLNTINQNMVGEAQIPTNFQNTYNGVGQTQQQTTTPTIWQPTTYGATDNTKESTSATG